MNSINRERLYFDVRENLDEFEKEEIIGSGGQGKVYKASNDRVSIAIKKSYLNNLESRYIDTPYERGALKYGHFIELAADKLINQLIFTGVSPHFVVSYTYDYKERDGICNEEYPYTGYHFIEYIYNSQTWGDWVREEHSIDMWYNAYFQITTALYALRKYFNMTHLDLHDENILVKRVEPGGYYHYHIDDVDYYLPNLGFRIYIIDFGHAWIPDFFQSWFIRQRYDSKKVNRSFDINELVKSSKGYSKAPKEFKTEMRSLIKHLKSKKFSTIIREFWGERYRKKPSRQTLLEKFDNTIELNESLIPKELRHLLTKSAV